MGTPCGSWSRARDRAPVRNELTTTGRPGRLRSDEHVWGLPQLVHPRDLAAVASGTSLACLTISVLRQCRLLAIPCGIENPFLSRLWKVPQLASAARWRESCFAKTCFCMDGVPWKKPTGLLGMRVDMKSVAKVCNGRVCDRTGKPHLRLEGTAPGGRMWTSIAEPYPMAFAKRLASTYVNSRMATDIALSTPLWMG